MNCWIALFVALATIQCISARATIVFVGNLALWSNEDGLIALFGDYGTVLDAIVMRERDSNRSKGFGFVTMSTKQEANSAIAALDNTYFDGRYIRVILAKTRQTSIPRRL